MPNTPIEHVVIIVKENHGFDTYFGRYPGVDGDSTLATAANPPTTDPRHDHKDWLKRATNASREQYDEHDIPAYWAYARQFTLCDKYFTDVAGPSTPNHLMLIAGDSPVVDNPTGGYRNPQNIHYDIPSLPTQLEQAGLTWGNYGGYAFEYITALEGKQRPSTQFATDAGAGTLPTVSWVYAEHVNSEHPPDKPADRTAGVGNVTNGMAWTVAQVEAIVAGNLWDKVAIFITWDDWGGWADHVDPSEVEQWTDGTQFRYGNRVPCLVLSPYAKAGHVSSELHSHVSLVHFCEETFNLASVTPRTAAADAMGDCFDFGQKPLGPPSSVSPSPTPGPAPTQSPGPPANVLREIRASAARAAARIADATGSTTDSHALEQLRYAAEDVDRITKLSSDG
jgi:phospholipase C